MSSGCEREQYDVTSFSDSNTAGAGARTYRVYGRLGSSRRSAEWPFISFSGSESEVPIAVKHGATQTVSGVIPLPPIFL